MVVQSSEVLQKHLPYVEDPLTVTRTCSPLLVLFVTWMRVLPSPLVLVFCPRKTGMLIGGHPLASAGKLLTDLDPTEKTNTFSWHGSESLIRRDGRNKKKRTIVNRVNCDWLWGYARGCYTNIHAGTFLILSKQMWCQSMFIIYNV